MTYSSLEISATDQCNFIEYATSLQSSNCNVLLNNLSQEPSQPSCALSPTDLEMMVGSHEWFIKLAVGYIAVATRTWLLLSTRSLSATWDTCSSVMACALHTSCMMCRSRKLPIHIMLSVSWSAQGAPWGNHPASTNTRISKYAVYNNKFKQIAKLLFFCRVLPWIHFQNICHDGNSNSFIMEDDSTVAHLAM